MGWRRLRLAFILFSRPKPSDSLARTAPILLFQFGMNARTPIDSPASMEHLLNVGGETSIFLLALTNGTLAPCIIPTLRDFQNSAHDDDGKLLRVMVNKLVCASLFP